MAAAVAGGLHDLDSVGMKAQTDPIDPPSHMHTPPASDQSSHDGKDDDAATSSDLSDLEDEMEPQTRFEEGTTGAGASFEQDGEELVVVPDRYEGGIPIFTPTMEQFKDFEKYVKGVDSYGMKSGIVLIDPPEEWKRARKPLDEMIKTIKVKNPITQEFHGAQGIYTQRNMEKQRTYNLPQWKALCENTENQPPAKRGERRLNADRLLGRGSAKRKSEPLPLAQGVKRRAGRPRVKPLKEEPSDNDYPEINNSDLLVPQTPISPETKSAVPVHEGQDSGTPGPTPVKKARQKPGPKPKGQQTKPATKRLSEKSAGKGSETTVAARRLRNARDANEDIDEEAFKNFDYRVYDNDQWTAERCDELEDKYWKSLNFSNPMYGADMPGSLFDHDTKEWNVAKLPNLLDLLGQPIPGVNTAYLYLGMWRATFAWHLEDVDLYSINYIHFGAPKQWYSISQADAPKFERAMRTLWGQDAKNCDQFLRHKTYLVSPSLLKQKFDVTVNKVVHREGQFVITFPIGYHSGYNLGYNCAESVNFAIENWLQFGKTAKKCRCEADSVFIDVDWFMRRLNGEPTPEWEEIEVTDDEDDMDDMPTDLPTPPGSDRGRVKVPSKRKRGGKDQGPNKKAKKTIRIKKPSKYQPCCLCPNDFAWEELLPTEDGQKAHKKCAFYTEETYIATKDGKETVFGIGSISRDRLELKCNECRQKKGSCFQCSSAKCTRAYHATCAAQAGVQIDEGDIAVWFEGVEYRDTGLDRRCRMHRTVKKSRASSDLVESNRAMTEDTSKELQDYLRSRKANDIIQYQAAYLDDIQAGVVIEPFNEDDGVTRVKILPLQRTIKEVEASWVLFVDSSTSCLQRPSANALDLPDHLLGQTASLPEPSDRKPSPGDPFIENPKTDWAEFVLGPSPRNKYQKQLDLSKDKQVWHFLGKTSTDTKAQYTADPSKEVYDPDSNFLQTLEPPRSMMAPPPQPKRLSLAASYPIMLNPINTAARNAAMVNARQQILDQQYRTAAQRRQYSPLSPAPYSNSIGHQQPSPEQRQFLERPHQKAQQLDQQSRPYLDVDLEAVQRQKHFLQQASQESRHYPTWPERNISSAHLAFERNTQLQRGSFPQDADFVPPSALLAESARAGQHVGMPNGYQRPYSSQGMPSSPQISQTARPVTNYDPHRAHISPTDHDRMNIEQARMGHVKRASDGWPSSPRHNQAAGSAYPFKPPEELKAQKERSLSVHSSPTQHHPPAPFGHEQLVNRHRSPSSAPGPLGHSPPSEYSQQAFINPNETQIKPGATSMSFPGSVTMGPPHPPSYRTVLPNPNAPPLPAPYFDQFTTIDASNVKAPSPKLQDSLSLPPVLVDGHPANDKVVPALYREWSTNGGFLAGVANYFIKSHRKRPSVYRSPYADECSPAPSRAVTESDGINGVGQMARDEKPRLAQDYYASLEQEDRAKIDAARKVI